MKRKEKLFIIVSFIAFIQPNFVVKISFLNNISIILALGCLIILMFRTTKKNVKLDYTIILLILWRLMFFFPTFLNNGEIIKWGYQSIVFIGLYLLTKNYINNKEAFKIIYKMIVTYVLLNIALMTIYPKGIFPMYGIHFLGIRTRFTEYSIALIYIALLYYNNFSNKDMKAKRIMRISMIIAVLNILTQWIATGIVVVISIFIIYSCIKNLKKIDLIYTFGFAVIIVMTINLVNGNLLNIFGGIFELLNKDITLTGRTLIWSNAINIVKKYFWIGYGYVNDGNIIPYSNGLWQAHNTILQSMCESGIIGTVTFFYIVFKQGYPSIKLSNKKVNALNVSVVFGFLIMMMSEILYYYPIFVFMLFLIGNSKNEIIRSQNDKE